MSYSAKITSKGQTTIPQQVRDHFGLRSGDQVDFVILEGGAMMIPKNKSIDDLLGMLGTPAGPEGEDTDESVGRYLAEDDERIMREWRERHK